tara:strand:- start:45 stop:575 length:531 start_codon:yes stop_codon:yes gene_type:complete
MAGSLIKIQETTVTSGNAVTLSGIDSTYDVYMVKGNNIQNTTDGEDLFARVTKDDSGTPTPQTTANYDGAYKLLRNDTTFGNVADSGLTYYRLFDGLGNATGEAGNIIMYLFNFNNSSEYSFMTLESVYMHLTIPNLGRQGGAVYKVAEAHNGIQFFLENSDNFTNATFTLYGLKK